MHVTVHSCSSTLEAVLIIFIIDNENQWLTGNSEDPHGAMTPDFVLQQKKRQQHQHATVIWYYSSRKKNYYLKRRLSKLRVGVANSSVFVRLLAWYRNGASNTVLENWHIFHNANALAALSSACEQLNLSFLQQNCQFLTTGCRHRQICLMGTKWQK